jgi:hypothetical protein
MFAAYLQGFETECVRAYAFQRIGFAAYLQGFETAYRVFETGTRVPILSYTHHRIAARSEDPQRAIEEAADKLLSTRQMEVRVEAEALPPEERRLVIRAAEERRFNGEETRRLVAARIEKARKAPPAEDPDTGEDAPLREYAALREDAGEDGGPDAEGGDDAREGRLILEEANERVLAEQIDEDIQDIMEVCPHCGASSSAWTRRPPDEPTAPTEPAP